MSYQRKADALFKDQLTSWPLLGANWEKLGAAEIRTFDFDGFTFRIQFNPKRIVSSAAKVDKVSIENRKCFLCPENRPPEEKEVYFGIDYEILCNPFPIFSAHYTISKRSHVPQAIEAEFFRFLEISRELPELVVFYNAPNCGASAPDHMHFQAGSLEFMPIESELGDMVNKYGNTLITNSDLELKSVDDGLRRFLVLESSKPALLDGIFKRVIRFMKNHSGGEEPMLNILCYYKQGWQVLIFPREKHRPWQFFETGDANILLSPAAVDMGGTLITPLEKDFRKITREDIEDIFSQISLNEATFELLNNYISNP